MAPGIFPTKPVFQFRARRLAIIKAPGKLNFTRRGFHLLSLAMHPYRILVFAWLWLGCIHTTPLSAATNPPVRVQGVITLVDKDRKLVVVQAEGRARVLRMESVPAFKVGERVAFEGDEQPLIDALPEFPDLPARREVIPGFSVPTNSGDFFLTRTRGYLHPPATGNYTFWIASDDASELWLSEDADPAKARRIACVTSGRFTKAEQWDQYPAQKSAAIHLETGKAYYVEALHQDGGGVDCMAVAWQGPGISRAVIEGRYLSLYGATDATANGSNSRGLLWEYWTNFLTSDLPLLRQTNQVITRFGGVKVLAQHEGELPEPLRVGLGQFLQENENFRFVETVGRLGFFARSRDGMELTLTEGPVRVEAHVQSGASGPFTYPENALLRVRGVAEATRDVDGKLQISQIWVNDPADVTWVDTEENWSQHPLLPAHELTSSNLSLNPGQLIHVRGTLLQAEPEGLWQVRGDDTFRGYVSSDGTNWIAVGAPVEFSMKDETLAGFAVASCDPNVVASAAFDQIRGVTREMTGMQIGTANRAGSFSFDGSTCRIEGAGMNIWNVADDCYFLGQKMTGEGEIVARLTELKTDHPLGKTALMIRESGASPSIWAGLLRFPGNRVGLQARRETSGRVAGAIVTMPGEWMKLVRQRNTFLIRPRAGQRGVEGGMLDIIGSLEWRNGDVLLNDALIRTPSIGSKTISGSSLNQLLAADEINDVAIKDLVSEDERAELEARVGIRFRIRGVTTYVGEVGGEPLLFVQDESGSCLVRLWGRISRVSPEAGQRVELTGRVSARSPIPEFSAYGCVVLGRANMPRPLKYPFDSTLMERRRGQWAEIHGVGRSLGPSGELQVMTREGPLTVLATKDQFERLSSCVDSLIRVRGVFWQTTKPVLLMSSSRFLQIEAPAPADPFTIPASPIAVLQDADSEQWAARRRKIAGVVTCKRENLIVVQNATGGVCVETSATADIAVGDQVEVAGFVSEQAFGLTMSDVLLRKTGRGDLPAPVELPPREGLEDRGKSLLTVTIEAVVLQKLIQGGMQSLDLQVEQRAFRAFLPVKDGVLPFIVNGSKVRVTGISQIGRVDTVGESGAAQQKPLIATLELLLRTPKDVVVIERPPWWNWKYTVATCGLVVMVFAGAILWIRTLRKRVEQRTHELRETMGKLQKETRISATLAERDRLAGEIHDSIEQGLSAIMMQMEAATKLADQPEEVRHYLAMAKNMAGFSRTEVQHAVWDMQSPLLENTDLPTALRRIANDISAGDAPRVTVEISGDTLPLPSAVEHHLLRIAQEALTNAVKHGSPKAISLSLRYQPDNVTLTVRDDGAGFVPETVSTHGGHFGLQGMRARAQKISAEMTLHSKPGEGACIEVVVSGNKSVSVQDENVSQLVK
jgi:signal transduction histidine kinase